MHRRALLVLMIPLLLCSCGSEREEDALASFREELTGKSVAVTADITQQWEDREFSCTVEATWCGGETKAVLTAPDTVAGVTFRTGEEDTLEYDGLILSLGSGTEELSPAMALHRTMQALTEGRVLYTGRDREQWFAVFPQEDSRITVYFSRETHMPVFSEIEENGCVALTVCLRGWRTEES